MKGKKVLITTAVIGALILPASVFAATSNAPAMKSIRGFFGIDTSKLTDTQKADVSSYTQKMADLQKEFINKMVANGSMTKVQGDAAIKKIDDAVKNGTFSPEGMGKEFGERGDRGKRGGFRDSEIDTSKLTDQQKADLKASYKKIADLQKELINKQVSSGLITKAQGDSAITKIDNGLNNDNYLKGMGRFEFEGFGLFGYDISKLTDQQKADLTDYIKKIADVQKEIINKEVADGLLTKAQGDTAIKRIDDMAANGFQPGFQGGMEKRRKGFGGHGPKGDFNQGTGSTPSTSTTTTPAT